MLERIGVVLGVFVCRTTLPGYTDLNVASLSFWFAGLVVVRLPDVALTPTTGLLTVVVAAENHACALLLPLLMPSRVEYVQEA